MDENPCSDVGPTFHCLSLPAAHAGPIKKRPYITAYKSIIRAFWRFFLCRVTLRASEIPSLQFELQGLNSTCSGFPCIVTDFAIACTLLWLASTHIWSADFCSGSALHHDYDWKFSLWAWIEQPMGVSLASFTGMSSVNPSRGPSPDPGPGRWGSA